MHTPAHTASVVDATRRAFLRDTARFIEALGLLDTTDDRVLRGLERWLTAATEAIRHHLALEPELLEALVPGRNTRLGVRMEEARTAVRDLLAVPIGERDTARRRAETAAVRLRAALLEHLDDESTERVARVAVTSGRSRAAGPGFRKRGLLASRYRVFELCWCLDAATPQERDVILGALPWPVRARHRLVLCHRYRRLSAVLEPTGAPRPGMQARR